MKQKFTSISLRTEECGEPGRAGFFKRYKVEILEPILGEVQKAASFKYAQAFFNKLQVGKTLYLFFFFFASHPSKDFTKL